MSYLRERLPEIETKPATFTPDLKGLIAWLETQDPAREYAAGDYNACLACRFASAVLGCKTVWRDIPPPLKILAWSGVAYTHGRFEHTYGAALSRARALVAK